MILQDAYEIAQALLDKEMRPDYGTDVVICSCSEFPNAWVFGFNTRQFLEQMEIASAIVGSGPIVVPKSASPAFFGKSGSPIERQIEHL